MSPWKAAEECSRLAAARDTATARVEAAESMLAQLREEADRLRAACAAAAASEGGLAQRDPN